MDKPEIRNDDDYGYEEAIPLWWGGEIRFQIVADPDGRYARYLRVVDKNGNELAYVATHLFHTLVDVLDYAKDGDL